MNWEIANVGFLLLKSCVGWLWRRDQSLLCHFDVLFVVFMQCQGAKARHVSYHWLTSPSYLQFFFFFFFPGSTFQPRLLMSSCDLKLNVCLGDDSVKYLVFFEIYLFVDEIELEDCSGPWDSRNWNWSLMPDSLPFHPLHHLPGHDEHASPCGMLWVQSLNIMSPFLSL